MKHLVKFAGLFLLCSGMLGGCEGQDNPIDDPEIIEFIDIPTEDQLEVMILPASHIASLTQKEAEIMLEVLADDGTLVFVEPLLEQLDAFCRTISNVAHSLGLEDFIASEAVQQILCWSDVSPFKDLVVGDEHDQYEIVALRAKTIYLSLNERENTVRKDNVVFYTDVADEDAEPDIQPLPAVEMEVENVVTDYSFGCKADYIAEWINQGEPSEEEEYADKMAASAEIATRAGETLDQLVKSQRIIINFGLGFNFKERNIEHPVNIQYDIWAANVPNRTLSLYTRTSSPSAQVAFNVFPSKESALVPASPFSATTDRVYVNTSGVGSGSCFPTTSTSTSFEQERSRAPASRRAERKQRLMYLLCMSF